jgi:elongation factor 1-gamma
MALKLYTYPGNFRAFKALIAAEYNGVDVEVPEFKMMEDNKTPEFLAKSPLGKVPVLETAQGCIFESNAIARFIARIRRDTGIYGSTFFESGQVDSWIDFCGHEIELPAVMWFYPVLGYLPANPAATEKAKSDLGRALAVLEAHLLDKTFLVGNGVTLADIVIASTLVYPFKLVCDTAYRSQFPCVMRWFDLLTHQPEFIAVIGETQLCAAELLPGGSAAPVAAAPAAAAGGNKKMTKKEKKAAKAAAGGGEQKQQEQKQGGGGDGQSKKKKKKKKKADEDDDQEPPLVPQEKKAEHPLKVLDKTSPSAFKGDTWKKHYSNDEYVDSFNWLWENIDLDGWSIWHADYKYNEENEKMFMVANLMGGFVQRSGEIRKWAFGTMAALGEEGSEIVVRGMWLIRSDTIQHLIDCNDDAEHYNWTMVAGPGTPLTDESKARIFEYWTSETTIEGLPIGQEGMASKLFK